MEADAAEHLEDVERGGGLHPGLQGLGWDLEEELAKKVEMKSNHHRGYPRSWTLDEERDCRQA